MCLRKRFSFIYALEALQPTSPCCHDCGQTTLGFCLEYFMWQPTLQHFELLLQLEGNLCQSGPGDL